MPRLCQTLRMLVIIGESLVRSLFQCVKFYHRLRPYHGNQMAQFVFNIAGHGNRVSNLLSQ